MWSLPGYSFLLSFCFVFYVINMKENIFIELLLSQNKPIPQNIFTADSYSPFSSVTKTVSQALLSSLLWPSLQTLNYFWNHWRFWVHCGLEQATALFPCSNKIIEIITNWKSSWRFSLTFDKSCQTHFLGQQRAGVSAVISHHKVPVVGWITDTCFWNSQIQTSDLYIVYEGIHYKVFNSWDPHMLGAPCVPPFLPLPLVFVYDLPNCISVSLQHIKLYVFLCFLNPSVLHDPSQRHAVPHPLLPAHCFPPILPFVLCFPSFNSFLTNWQEQASMKSAWTETTAGSCSYHSATETTRVCTQGMFPEHTKGGSLGSRSYCVDSQLSHVPGDSAFPTAKSLILF